MGAGEPRRRARQSRAAGEPSTGGAGLRARRGSARAHRRAGGERRRAGRPCLASVRRVAGPSSSRGSGEPLAAGSTGEWRPGGRLASGEAVKGVGSGLGL